MIICIGVMLLYVWINYDDIRSEQRYRQIWHMNNKAQMFPPETRLQGMLIPHNSSVILRFLQYKNHATYLLMR